ncbi:BLUF domain-containing protein [uncultured Paracoccus sp.]|uniref:BLUF domain-containing protein n=1 Tax=uncultured Paracoccus sp. TaxID=189685 RepID=UPI0032B17DA2|tara:strand:- start:275 stop:679 length:405 start_codon:yes stop_codon:yes gene_type:complete
MEHLLALLYRSNALTHENGREDRKVLEAARNRNALSGVTGFLHRENDVFYQWLEGPAENVRGIYRSISEDLRHRDMHVLDERLVAGRSFAGWSMGYSNQSKASLFDWAAEHGIPLHSPSSDHILEFMLSCSRGR